MTMIIGISNRDTIIRYASVLLPEEDRANPVLIAATAIPILEWAEQAADADDLRCRMLALSRQYVNTHAQHGTGSPDRFVEDAGTLYAFIAAGRD
jgi:hypothetical protein